MKPYRNARAQSIPVALAFAMGAALHAVPSSAHSGLIDFETGVTKGTQVSRQFEASHGIKLAIVDKTAGTVSYPRIGETFETDPGCLFDSLLRDAGCGKGTSDAW